MKTVVQITMHTLVGGIVVYRMFGLFAFMCWFLPLARYLGLVSV